jgi:hypothetical protein
MLQYLELALSQQDLGELGLDTMEFPILQRAALEHVYGQDPDPFTAAVDTFDNAPLLSGICLTGHAAFCYYILPSLQLTTFESGIEDLELFAVAPKLTEAVCSVDFLGPISPIYRAHLQSLVLEGNLIPPRTP